MSGHPGSWIVSSHVMTFAGVRWHDFLHQIILSTLNLQVPGTHFSILAEEGCGVIWMKMLALEEFRGAVSLYLSRYDARAKCRGLKRSCSKWWWWRLCCIFEKCLQKEMCEPLFLAAMVDVGFKIVSSSLSCSFTLFVDWNPTWPLNLTEATLWCQTCFPFVYQPGGQGRFAHLFGYCWARWLGSAGPHGSMSPFKLSLLLWPW